MKKFSFLRSSHPSSSCSSHSGFSCLGPVIYLLIVASILFIVAIGLTWFLEYRYFMLDSASTADFVFNRSKVFFYNVFLVWLFLVGLTAITRRPFLASGISWALLIVITFIEMEKFSARGTPLLPEDFMLATEAASLTQFVDAASIIQTVIAALLAVVFGAYLEWLWRHFVVGKIRLSRPATKELIRKNKGTSRNAEKSAPVKSKNFHKSPQPHFYIIRLVILTISTVSLIIATDFVRNHSGEKYQWIDFLDSELVAWNQTRNYNNNGFILGFLYNLQKFDLTTPDNYSQETIDKIMAKYASEKSTDESASSRTSLADEDYNIVVILNESFYDPTVLAGYYDYSPRDIIQNENSANNSADSTTIPANSTTSSTDFGTNSANSASASTTAEALLPNLYKIFANYPHGQMYSLDYGGGTANIEFEADTGLTNYWLGTVPYTDLVPRTDKVPSIASWAKSNGYEATAIHSYNGGMYKRNISLIKEGFDELIDESQMQNRTKESDSAQYLNDQAIYNEALDLLESRESKQLVSLITMQNHTPYEDSTYGDNLEFGLTNPSVCSDDQSSTSQSSADQSSTDQSCITAEEKRQIEVYLQSLHNSDKYLGEFISALENSDEKTVVLFYGDHSAGLFSLVNNSDDKNVRDLTRLTPYFIYANFDLPVTSLTADSSVLENSITDNPVAKNSPSTLPTTTPNCLTNSLYNILNIQKPTLSYLTAAVCSTTPILAPTYFESDSLIETDILRDYKMITYDILGGKQYSLDE